VRSRGNYILLLLFLATFVVHTAQSRKLHLLITVSCDVRGTYCAVAEITSSYYCFVQHTWYNLRKRISIDFRKWRRRLARNTSPYYCFLQHTWFKLRKLISI